MESASVVLLKQCKLGEREALNTLLAQYEKYVYTLCFHYTHSKEDALDLTQEVFIKVIKGIGDVDLARPFNPWLKKVVVNTCLNFVRDSKPTLSLDEVMTESGETFREAVTSQFNLEAYIIFNETSEVIRKSIQKLDNRYKMPLILRHEQNLSYEEISDTLDLPIGTVKNLVYRGRKQLQALLVEKGLWG